MNNTGIIKIIEPYISKDLEVKGNGLFSGLMGKAIFFFVLGKITNDIKWRNKAMDILGILSSRIPEEKSMNFEDGVAGIGWGVEWLVQTKLLTRTNTDEVLEEIDNLLYKKTVFVKDNNASLGAGLVGELLYFYKRHISHNPGTHPFKRIAVANCLNITIDRLHDLLLSSKEDFFGANNSLKEESTQEILLLGQTVYLLANISKLNINKSVTDDLLFNLIKKIDYILFRSSCQPNAISLNNKLAVQYMCGCYLACGKTLKIRKWTKNSCRYLEFFKTEIDVKLLNHKQLRRYINTCILVGIHGFEAENICSKSDLDQSVEDFFKKDEPFLVEDVFPLLILFNLRQKKIKGINELCLIC